MTSHRTFTRNDLHILFLSCLCTLTIGTISGVTALTGRPPVPLPHPYNWLVTAAIIILIGGLTRRILSSLFQRPKSPADYVREYSDALSWHGLNSPQALAVKEAYSQVPGFAEVTEVLESWRKEINDAGKSNH